MGKEKRVKQRLTEKRILFLVILLSLFILSTPIVTAGIINSTAADGLVAYSRGAATSNPGYRVWNRNITNFTSMSTNTQNTSSAIQWIVTQAGHERDEMIMGMETSGSLSISTQVWNGTSFGNFLQHSKDILNSDQRAFDIAYEDLSGDALIVYEHSTASDSILGYKIWNGTNYSSESNVTLTGMDRAIRWVQLHPRPGTDQIMLIAVDDAFGNVLSAIVWNGTSFDAGTEVNATSSLQTDTEENMHFAWERLSGDGLFVYGISGGTWAYRTYNSATRLWSTQATFLTLNTGNTQFVRLCSDPNSDTIGFISYDTTFDVNVRIWDGNAVETSPSPPSEETDTERDSQARHIDCQWEGASRNEAVFTWVDNNGLAIQYTNYTQGASNAWGTANLETPQNTTTLGADDLRAVRAMANPVSNEIMYLVGDIQENLTMTRWNGSTFTTNLIGPVEGVLACTDAYPECFSFSWDQYDTVPSVTTIQPDGTNFNNGTNVAINVTITDNVNVSQVMANVTFPNGSSAILFLTDGDNNNVYTVVLNNTAQRGFYNISIIANDTSSHNNINNNMSVLFSAGDVFPPTVVNLTLPDGEAYNRSDRVMIRVNVTDNTAVDTVLLNITLPNGSVITTMISNTTGNRYEHNFTNASTTGTYNITVIANDTSTNRNTNQTAFFTAGDVTKPVVQALTPIAGTSINLNAVVNITVNATDNGNISTVYANVRLSNGSLVQVAMSNNTPNLFNGILASTSIDGVYNITIVANDSENNVNNSTSTHINVGDTLVPTIALIGPANMTNTSLSNLIFNATISDNSATINCSLIIGGSFNQTNSSIANNTIVRFALNNVDNATYNWSINCTDGVRNTNQSLIRVITSDRTLPTITSITLTPNSTIEVDPNIGINVTIAASDSQLGIDTVVFQYKLATDSQYTNHTTNRTGEGQEGQFNASFIPTIAGNWTYRAIANDSVGNQNISDERNISVATDRIWTRLPAIAPTVASAPSTNVTIVNLTINNTGDFAQSFSVSSTYANTSYNSTFPLDISANSANGIAITATAPNTAGITTITLTTNTSDQNANPQSLTTIARIGVAAGNPLLSARFTATTTSAVLGQTGIAFTAELQNIGENNASNVSLFFTYPENFTLTAGNANVSFDVLDVNETRTQTVQFTINQNVTLGSHVVDVNTTGFNASGVSLSSLSLVAGDSATLTITSQSGGGSEESGGGGNDGKTTGATIGGGGGGGGDTPKQIQKTLEQQELVETAEVVELVRGKDTSFAITITNVFAETTLHDVRLDIQGYLSNYLSWQPAQLDGIDYKTEKDFIIRLDSPAYQDSGAYELTAIITGKATSGTLGSGQQQSIVQKNLYEKRTILLVIQDYSREEAEQFIAKAQLAVTDMKSNGIATSTMEQLTEQLQAAVAERRYNDAKALFDKIIALKAAAVEAKSLLSELQELLQQAEQRGILVDETKKVYQLALSAFEREDFLTAKERAEEAKLLYLLETKGEINILAILQRFWWIILPMLLAFGIVATLLYQKYIVTIISHRIARLEKEEATIHSLMQDTQQRAFEKKEISVAAYHKNMAHYQERLQQISTIKAKLRVQRAGVIRISQEIATLKKEYQQAMISLKKIQEEYYAKHAISKNNYDLQTTQLKKRMAAIEGSIATLELKLKREGRFEEAMREVKEHLQRQQRQSEKQKLQQDLSRDLPQDLSNILLQVRDGARYGMKKIRGLHNSHHSHQQEQQREQYRNGQDKPRKPLTPEQVQTTRNQQINQQFQQDQRKDRQQQDKQSYNTPQHYSTSQQPTQQLSFEEIKKQYPATAAELQQKIRQGTWKKPDEQQSKVVQQKQQATPIIPIQQRVLPPLSSREHVPPRHEFSKVMPKGIERKPQYTSPQYTSGTQQVIQHQQQIPHQQQYQQAKALLRQPQRQFGNKPEENINNQWAIKQQKPMQQKPMQPSTTAQAPKAKQEKKTIDLPVAPIKFVPFKQQHQQGRQKGFFKKTLPTTKKKKEGGTITDKLHEAHFNG